jgi:hypothetical protein
LADYRALYIGKSESTDTIVTPITSLKHTPEHKMFCPIMTYSHPVMLARGFQVSKEY